MTTVYLSLVVFALWTLLVLMFTVGAYRWIQILTRRAPIHAFRSDVAAGPDWYRRSVRAHANCIENLPVFTAIVVALSYAGAQGSVIDAMAVVIPGARMVQTTVHVTFEESQRTVSVRFFFFLVQFACMSALGALAAIHLLRR